MLIYWHVECDPCLFVLGEGIFFYCCCFFYTHLSVIIVLRLVGAT